MNVDQFISRTVNRREFLGRSAQNAAGVAAGVMGLSSPVAGSPNERIQLAVIGARNQGLSLAESLAAVPDAAVHTVCDVDDAVLAKAVRQIGGVQGRQPRLQQDFRAVLDDPAVDAVVIATPDHWHAPMTILACQAGKDVYVEKPASHSLAEGAVMLRAAQRSNRIVQVGIQQRSGDHFQSAMRLLQSGQLGAVRLAKAWVTHCRKEIGFRADRKTPAGLDYDLWLGPACQRNFNPNRFHYNWRWFWDYGGGELGNWGVHLLDVASWGLGVGLPSRISASGGKYHLHDDQQTPDTLMVNFSYPSCTIVWEHRLWNSRGLENRNSAVAFYGELGTLVIDRSGWKVYDCEPTLSSPTSEQTQPHLRDFLDCVKSRRQPVANLQTALTSTNLCHLGNIAYRVGREVNFDVNQENFGNDVQANALLACEYRPGWELPGV